MGGSPLHMGASWTTGAPFRETEAMIARCRAQGILAMEMEAAALYALAQARQYQIICFAHVTNQMGQSEGDFEKGEPRVARQPCTSSVKRLAHGDKGRPGEGARAPWSPGEIAEETNRHHHVGILHFYSLAKQDTVCYTSLSRLQCKIVKA